MPAGTAVRLLRAEACIRVALRNSPALPRWVPGAARRASPAGTADGQSRVPGGQSGLPGWQSGLVGEQSTLLGRQSTLLGGQSSLLGRQNWLLDRQSLPGDGKYLPASGTGGTLDFHDVNFCRFIATLFQPIIPDDAWGVLANSRAAWLKQPAPLPTVGPAKRRSRARHRLRQA